jgi:hypothetical protein
LGPPAHPVCRCFIDYQLEAREHVSESDGDGVWRTIRGAKVFIQNGRITKGPKELIDNKPDEIDGGDGGYQSHEWASKNKKPTSVVSNELLDTLWDKGSEHEYGYYIDADTGEVLREKSGEGFSTAPGEAFSTMGVDLGAPPGDRPVIQLHTHPDESSFSDADWGMMGWSDIKGMVVRDPKWIYRIEKAVGRSYTARELRDGWNATLEKLEAKMGLDDISGLLHAVSVQMGDTFPNLEYTRTAIGVRESLEHCGANAPGGGGFQKGNTCGAEDGEAKPKRKDQTQTKAFKAWFGDSKVVDENGKPLVVYHGTNTEGEFTTFQAHASTRVVRMDGQEFLVADSWDMEDGVGRPEALHYAAVSDVQTMGADEALKFRRESMARLEKEHGTKPSGSTRRHIADLERMSGKKVTVTNEMRPSGDGFYFTPDPNYSYIKNAKQVMPVYLSLQNPKYVHQSEIESGGLSWNVEKYKAEGYDGLIAGNPKDLKKTGWDGSTQIVAFSPNQIKSATGNRGTFSRKSNRIDEQHHGA